MKFYRVKTPRVQGCHCIVSYDGMEFKALPGAAVADQLQGTSECDT